MYCSQLSQSRLVTSQPGKLSFYTIYDLFYQHNNFHNFYWHYVTKLWHVSLQGMFQVLTLQCRVTVTQLCTDNSEIKLKCKHTEMHCSSYLVLRHSCSLFIFLYHEMRCNKNCSATYLELTANRRADVGQVFHKVRHHVDDTFLLMCAGVTDLLQFRLDAL